jgi:hypothetical protein
VVHKIEAALYGNICSLMLSCVLGFKSVLEEGRIGVTELKYPAALLVKHLINILNAVGSDFLSSTSKQCFVLSISVGKWTVAYVWSSWSLVPSSLFITSV